MGAPGFLYRLLGLINIICVKVVSGGGKVVR